MRTPRSTTTLAAVAAALLLSAAPAVAAPLRPDSTLRAGGLGSVRVGMTITQAERAGGVDIAVDRFRQGSCGTARIAGGTVKASFLLDGFRIARVDVREPGVRALGFQVGDRAADLRARYGDRLRSSRHTYVPQGRYLEFRQRGVARRRIVFETDGPRITLIRAGRLPEVRYVEGCL